MNVIVDTPVWSSALRRPRVIRADGAHELRALIRDRRARIMGAVRQEILSGIRDQRQFEQLRGYLDAFPDIALDEEDHVHAARYFNTCRAAGIQGSNTDFLICAVAARRGLSIFTTDGDFDRFARLLPIERYEG